METGNNLPFSKPYSECKISVFFSKDGYSFIVSDLNDGSTLYESQYIAFKKNSSYQLSFEESLMSYPYLRNEFGDEELILNVERYTFVPSEFFSVDMVNKYYTFNLGEPDSKEGVFYSLVDSLQMYVIFSYDKAFIDLLENIFPQAQFTPGISLLIDRCDEKGRELMNAVFARIKKNVLEVVVYKSTKFAMANTFLFVNVKDAEYFLLRAYYNFGFDNSIVPVYLESDMELPDIGDFVKTINFER